MGSGDVVDKMLPRVEGYKGAQGNPKFFVQGKTWTRYPNPNPHHAGENGGADRWGGSMRWGRLTWGSRCVGRRDKAQNALESPAKPVG
jgi:hypothetical protein